MHSCRHAPRHAAMQFVKAMHGLAGTLYVHTLLIEHCSNRYAYATHCKTIAAICNVTRGCRDNSFERKGETRAVHASLQKFSNESTRHQTVESTSAPLAKKVIMIPGIRVTVSVAFSHLINRYNVSSLGRIREEAESVHSIHLPREKWQFSNILPSEV